MAVEVGAEAGGEEEALCGAANRTEHFYIGEDATAKSLQPQRRSHSVPIPRPPPGAVAPSAAPVDDPADAEELQLLWELWEVQQSLSQEEEVLRQAIAAQHELELRNDAKRQQLRDLEAELREREVHSPEQSLALSGRLFPTRGKRRSRAAGGSAGLQAQVEALLAANDALQESIKEVETRLRADSQSSREPLSRSAGRTLYGRLAAQQEVEAMESELAQWRRMEARRSEEHRHRIEELQEEIREVEGASRERRAALREELAEALAEAEVLQSELDGAVRARAVTVERLREEEKVLLGELGELACEEAASSAGSNASPGAPHPESYADTRSNSITTLGSLHSSVFDGGLCNLHDERPESPTFKDGFFGDKGSLFHELQDSPEGSRRPSVELQVDGSALQPADAPVVRRKRLLSRAKSFTLGYRTLGPPGPIRNRALGGAPPDASGPPAAAEPPDGGGGAPFIGPASRLSVIGEADAVAAQLAGAAPPSPTRSSPSRSSSSGRSSGRGSAQCGGSGDEAQQAKPRFPWETVVRVVRVVKALSAKQKERDAEEAEWSPPLPGEVLSRPAAPAPPAQLAPQVEEAPRQLLELKRLAVERGMPFAEAKGQTAVELQRWLFHQDAAAPNRQCALRQRIRARRDDLRRIPLAQPDSPPSAPTPAAAAPPAAPPPAAAAGPTAAGPPAAPAVATVAVAATTAVAGAPAGAESKPLSRLAAQRKARLEAVAASACGRVAAEAVAAAPAPELRADAQAPAAVPAPAPTARVEAEACHGFLEWTVHAAEEEAAASPRWAGPFLFAVDGGVLRGKPPGAQPEGAAMELAISLMAVSAVREQRQDPSGRAFVVRYRPPSGGRAEVAFRTASREERSLWVQGLCNAISELRRQRPRKSAADKDPEAPAYGAQV